MKIEKKIKKAQKAWAKGLINIGKAAVCTPNKIEKKANEMLDRLYDFRVGGKTEILFKPTLASEHPFRINRVEALSYFIGGLYKEDKGFALKPWKNVKFGDFYFIQQDNHVMVMGEYTFIDYQENETVVDYTFGYRIEKNSGELKIFLHHSSLRFQKNDRFIQSFIY